MHIYACIVCVIVCIPYVNATIACEIGANNKYKCKLYENEYAYINYINEDLLHVNHYIT